VFCVFEKPGMPNPFRPGGLKRPNVIPITSSNLWSADNETAVEGRMEVST
jgi:hypothetical protein